MKWKKFTLKHVKKNANVPETLLKKHLNDCRVALICTAGVHLKSDPAFDVDNPAGDHSVRFIPSESKPEDLDVTHIYYDTRFAKSDPSVVFPLEQMKELAGNGVIGSISNLNIGLNGGILDTALVEKVSIPKVVMDLTADQVAMITILPEITNEVGVPRSLHVPFKLGRPCGEPFDFETRRRVVLALLKLTSERSGTIEQFCL